jgi:hypothetical protein
MKRYQEGIREINIHPELLLQPIVPPMCLDQSEANLVIVGQKS